MDSKQIELDPSKITLKPLSTDPEIVNLSIDSNKEAGTFHGQIFLLLGQSLSSFPIKASTAPLVEIAVLWVVVGIVELWPSGK